MASIGPGAAVTPGPPQAPYRALTQSGSLVQFFPAGPPRNPQPAAIAMTMSTTFRMGTLFLRGILPDRSLHRNDRDLFQSRPMPLGIRLALPRRKLLHRGAGWRRAREILGVDAVHRRELIQVVQINVAGCYVRKVHAGLFQPVQQIAHGLAKL